MVLWDDDFAGCSLRHPESDWIELKDFSIFSHQVMCYQEYFIVHITIVRGCLHVRLLDPRREIKGLIVIDCLMLVSLFVCLSGVFLRIGSKDFSDFLHEVRGP